MKVKVDKLGINGEGVFRLADGELKGKVGFVYYALPNEIVDVDITKNKSKFCEAKMNRILIESRNRINPPCPYFYKCGGCDLQHADIQTQLDFKKSKVEDTIAKIAKIDNPHINEVIHINDFGYRNKMVFPFGVIKDKAILGMYERDSHNIVDISSCILTTKGINEILILSKKICESSEKYIKLIKDKILKHLVVREYNDSYLITIVASKHLDLSDYYKYISANKSNMGLSLIIGDSDNEILSGKYEYIDGLKQLQIEEYGLKYKIDNRGFLQVNNEIKCAIYDKILESIDSQDYVIDAYSGAGLLSSIMAKKSKYASGIEINVSASKSAEELAKINGLHNTKFYCNDVKDKIEDCLKEYRDSVLVLDPARSGCDRLVLDKILKSNLPKKIIYLSCNVATLSRDLSILNEKYDISYIGVYDMFPNTKHVETLIIMKRKL